MDTEQPQLEAVRVLPSSGSIWTVVGMDCDTGTLYGIAADARMAGWIAEELDCGQMPPLVAPEPWQILWVQEADWEL